MYIEFPVLMLLEGGDPLFVWQYTEKQEYFTAITHGTSWHISLAILGYRLTSCVLSL
jgi:hypothetical protein